MDVTTYDHQKSSLDLELFVYPLVFNRVIPQLLIEAVAVGSFNDTGREDLRRETMEFDRRDPPDVR